KNVLRAILNRARDDIEVVAINELANIEEVVHLFVHDSTFGRFPGSMGVIGPQFCDPAAGTLLAVDGMIIKYLSEPDPAKLPWKELDVDIVLECTGRFVDHESAEAHIRAGAKRVIISAPAKGVPLYVCGVNHQLYHGEHIISNASCTTNCAAVVARAIDEAFGITHAKLTTMHAGTAGQNVVDGTPPGRKGGDLRLARATIGNLIPTKTGAAKSVGDVLPALLGKFDGIAVRDGRTDVSLCDLTFVVQHPTSVEEVNAALRAASTTPSYNGVLGHTIEPLVSSDFLHDPRSAIVDLPLTRVIGGTLVSVMAWYDNEWGYSCRMVDMARVVVGPTIAR
ncbi:MAG: glyceraldehyde 3-phosphate dehydrogenase NAD-binding domain-containing protein, partial [bacterium]|nr:glyceraldehyde 3-phosphate dehydrogenase NAD-binding domain-containing protein [bacterium]